MAGNRATVAQVRWLEQGSSCCFPLLVGFKSKEELSETVLSAKPPVVCPHFG